MRRPGVVAGTLAMLTVVAGCGSSEQRGTDTAAAPSRSEKAIEMPTKRLPSGRPCDLISGEEIAKIVGKNVNQQFPPEESGKECAYSLRETAGITIYRGLPESTLARGESTKIGNFSGKKQDVADICALFLPLKPQDSTQVIGAASSLLPNDRMSSCAASEEILLTMYERLPG